MGTLDARALFDQLHPGFFDLPFIRGLPEGQIYEEMALWLSDFSPDAVSIPAPEGVAFGLYRGDREALRRAVALVDGDWPQYFGCDTPVYCALAGHQPVSFCILSDFGVWKGLRIGGPGCVGTVPGWRRRGIGLKMVQRATAALKEKGYDLSWIHFTGVAPWYAHLGYRTVLQWNKNGFLDENRALQSREIPL